MTQGLPKFIVKEKLPRLGAADIIPNKYLDQSMAQNTHLSYGYRWQAFVKWCAEHGRASLPSDTQTICDYLAYRADSGSRASSIYVALAAIGHHHEVGGYADPRRSIYVRKTMSGIRRALGTRPEQKNPLLVRELKLIGKIMTDSHFDCRHWSMLTLGFAGGFRISELLNLQMEDVRIEVDGVRVLVRKSKMDQDGRGHVKFIRMGQHKETCPVENLKRWFQWRGMDAGPIFVSSKGRVRVSKDGILCQRNMWRNFQDVFKRAGLDPDRYSTHSMRAGFVTAGRSAGLTDAQIMAITGHKSATTLNIYDRRDPNEVNTTARIGL